MTTRAKSSSSDSENSSSGDADRAALRASLAQQGWLPIETAPKDGTEVLVWTRAEGDVAVTGYCSVAYWDELCEGWLIVENIYASAPTHWRRLPDPPETTDGT